MPTLHLSPNFRLHAFQSGTVQVRPPHFEYNGPEFLKQARILFSRKWTEPLPIWIWVIESPEGNFLVDTGENVRYNDPDYFGSDKPSQFVHRRILNIDISPEEELEAHLDSIGLSVTDLDAVIITHMHIDHTDGLHAVADRKILVTQREMNNLWGAVPSTWPTGFKPDLIDFKENKDIFQASHTLTSHISLVPTFGHSHGHQSVWIHHDRRNILIAGDTTFNQDQLTNEKIGGISIDFKRARETNRQILNFARSKGLVYLPSHDPDSARRMGMLEPVVPRM